MSITVYENTFTYVRVLYITSLYNLNITYILVEMREYIRGWEDCLDTLNYLLHREKVKDEKVFKIIEELRTAVKTDKIEKLLDELGLP